MSINVDLLASEREAGEAQLMRDEAIALSLVHLADGADHPEIWANFAVFLARFPDLIEELTARLIKGDGPGINLAVLRAVCVGLGGRPEQALAEIEPLGSANSQSPLIQVPYSFWRDCGTATIRNTTSRTCSARSPFNA